LLSLFPNEDILTKEIESWKSYADSLHSDNRDLFMNMLNECYKYAASINAKGQLLSQHKIIDLLTKQISKYELLVNNSNKEELKKSEEVLGRENAHDYISKNERIHYIDD
jgi:hypothetical protein